MNQKHAVVLFIILLITGLGIGVSVKFKDEFIQVLSKKESSPESSSKADYFFDTNKQKDPNSLTNPAENLKLNDLISGKAKLESPTNNLKSSTNLKSFDKFPGIYAQDELKDKAAIIQTKKGNIYIYLFPDTPLASSNFIFLANQLFYDGLKFHRLEKDFVVQGGDPKGDGTGGPGYQFPDEKVIGNYIRGVVAMANAGANTNGSQFFIILKDQPTLPPKYTIFGKVFKGMEVVDQLVAGDVMEKVAIVRITQDNN